MTEYQETGQKQRRPPPTARIRTRSSDHQAEPFWEGIRKPPRIPDADQLQAMHWSKSALAACISRSARDDAFESWTGAVEGVWWALALDEALEGHFYRIYQEARAADPGGRMVQGMRWLRNRHAHDILVTAAGGAKRPFLSSAGEEGFIYISPSNRWMPSKDIIGQRRDEQPGARPDYDEHVAGWSLHTSLELALKWFDNVFEASQFPHRSIPNDPTVLGRA